MPLLRRVLFAFLALAASTALLAQTKEWHSITPATAFNLGINPLNPASLYCERSAGLIFISRNRGASWSPVGDTLPISGIRHILVHPNDTLTIFAMAFSGGLWKTTNEGSSWYKVIDTYGIDGESIDYDPAHPDTMYAGAFSGAIYRTTNRGETWTFQGSAGSELCALTLRPDSVNILYAGTGSSSISKSTDLGVTWRVVNTGGADEVPKIVVDPSHPLVAYATTFGNDVDCNLWKTTDGGETWFKTALQHIGIWALALDVQHPETVYVGRFGASYGVDRTTDGGATFQRFEKGLPTDFAAWNLRVHPLAPSDVWLAGTGGFFGAGGVFHLVDSIPTRIRGTIRDSASGGPIVASIAVDETGQLLVDSTYDLAYLPGDSLSVTVHVSRSHYATKDTVLTFIPGTIQSKDLVIAREPFGSISGTVFNDLNNNGVRDSSEPGITGRQIVLTGGVFKFGFTDANGSYLFDSLDADYYTVQDVPPAGWTRTVPLAGFYTFLLGPGVADTGRAFGSFHPNMLAVRKYEDLDGDFATSGDRVLKSWHLEIEHTSAPVPVVIAAGDTSAIGLTNLVDGIYTVSEADSAWLPLGYLLDGVPIATSARSVPVSLVDGQKRTVDFVNAAPGYLRTYRTARAEDWATAVDAKGKHKSVKRKPDKVFFKFTLSVATPAVPVLDLKFSMAVDSVRVTAGTLKLDTLPYVTRTVDPKRKVWHYDFGAVSPGDVLQVDGIGLTGKHVKASYVWTDLALTTKVKGNIPDLRSAFLKNDLGMPRPNLTNVGEELFPKGFQQISPYFATGLQVGVPQGLKGANAVLIKKYSNVVKSFIVERTGQTHTGPPDCLDSLDNGKLINKLQALLPPDKQNNSLFADLLAAKLNIAASATGKFPFGFGELTFQDGSDPGNPFNGQTVAAIIQKADTLISCQPLLSKGPSPTVDELADVLEKLNAAFADSENFKDTLSFTAKTSLPGVRRLEDVHYLQPTPGLAPVMFRTPDTWDASLPQAFSLEQNYPNPFNPATTIAFDLPEPASITLKVYNMLGQEVATLLDHEDLDEGTQEVEFDATMLPSGVYFYRLVASGEEGAAFTAVKKMLLVR